MKLLAHPPLLLALLPSVAWTLTPGCPQLVVTTSPTAGGVTTVGIKFKALSSPAPLDLVLKVTLPPGVVLKGTRQHHAGEGCRSNVKSAHHDTFEHADNHILESAFSAAQPDPINASLHGAVEPTLAAGLMLYPPLHRL
jgi:hypothetical protein